VSALLLDDEEVKEYTGVRGGYKGKTRTDRQAAWLKQQKIPFQINAVNRVVIARAVLTGGPQPAASNDSWEPD